MSDFIAFQKAPTYVMVKPAGPLCNLNCRYCYYTEKTSLYKNKSQMFNNPMTMTDELLEKFIKEYIEMQPEPYVLFTWHGGEPLLRPISFYKKALALQQKYGQGKQIDNCLQTNGTLINDQWAKFFRDNQFLIGLSIDGPKEVHDAYRLSRGERSTWNQVMKGIHKLNEYGVEWNALAVINDLNVKAPLEFYNFFRKIGCHYIQFTPVVERQEIHQDGRHLANPISNVPGKNDVLPFSIKPKEWGDFLCTLFDEWVRHDVGDTFIQIFDATLANWMGVLPGVCTLAPTCGHALAMEHNGDVFACDHYVFPEFKLGNIMTSSLTTMAKDPKQVRFGANKRDALPQQCKECDWLFACNGECPRLRFEKDRYGNPGLNYLCAGYKRFFAHVAPYMDYMKYQLKHDGPPAAVMEWIAEGMPNYE